MPTNLHLKLIKRTQNEASNYSYLSFLIFMFLTFYFYEIGQQCDENTDNKTDNHIPFRNQKFERIT